MDLAQLLEAERPALFRYALGFTRDRDDAEDLVQDTFTRALGRASQLRNNAALRSWLKSALKNLHIDKMRARKETHDIENIAIHEHPMIELGDIEGRVAFQEAMDRQTTISDEKLEIFRLYYLSDMSAKEVAAATGQTVPAIKAHLYRARMRLQNIAASTLAA